MPRIGHGALLIVLLALVSCETAPGPPLAAPTTAPSANPPAALPSSMTPPALTAVITPHLIFTPVTPYPTMYYPPGVTPISPFPTPGVTPPPGNRGERILTSTPEPIAPPPFVAELKVIYPGPANWAAWSPTGQYIMFDRDISPGEAEIYVTDPQGAAVTYVGRTSGVRISFLPYDQALLANPVWSPDGRQILYTVAGTDGRNELWVANVDGSSKLRIAEADPLWKLKWLADGRIVFSRDGKIYSVDHKGQGERVLSSVPVDPLSFNLSPDGNKFANNVHGLLVLMNVEGTDPKGLGPTKTGESAWSHDGSRLAYMQTYNDSSFEALWVIDRDGSDPRLVDADVASQGGTYALSWSPDDQWLAFGHTPTGAGTASEGAIYIVKPSGWGPHPLVMRGVYRPLSWSPDKSFLAYTRYSTPDTFPITNLELVVGRLRY